MQTEKREKIFAITAETVASLLRCDGKAFRVVSSECPKDAEFVSCVYDFDSNTFLLKMRHPTFCIIPEGAVIPYAKKPAVLEDVTGILLREFYHAEF